jgi:hypothetical protein
MELSWSPHRPKLAKQDYTHQRRFLRASVYPNWRIHMPLTIRRALVGGAMTAAVLGTVGIGPAIADDTTPSPECVTATAAVATAKTDFATARKAFVATNKPLGKLLAAERTAARTEVRTSRLAIHQLQKQAAKLHDQTVREALRAQIAAQRADIRHSTRLLASKAALRAQALADRKAAKVAFATARAAYVAAEIAAVSACSDEPSTPTV